MVTTRASALIYTATLLTVAGTASAQEAVTRAGSAAATDQEGAAAAGLEEIVVTATKTGATQLQKTPLAVSAYSADQLNTSVVTNVKDLVSLTPSLNVSQATASAQIYIRGIGSNNVFNGSDPDVTVQSDGVYIARAFGQFADFIDVDRVEVLRGPQGTLYGRNAVGGTINIISRLPTDDFQNKAQVTLGNFSLLQTQDYVSGALVKGVADASLSVNYITHSPYETNLVPGQPGAGEADRGGVRAQLLLKPADAVNMITRADYNKSAEDFASSSHLLSPYARAPLASSIVGDYTQVALDWPQVNHEQIWGVSEEINALLSDQLSLKSITAYRDSWYRLSVDVDGTELPVIEGFQSDDSKQVSQELNLVANVGRFDGVGGLYYFNEHEISVVGSALPSPGPNFKNAVTPDAHARSEAAFAQGTYHLFDTVGLTAGIRYTKERKELDQTYSRTSLATSAFLPGFPFLANTTRDFHALTPKFGVDWQMSPDALLYLSATRGFKSGGTNYAASNVAALSFAPEYIWSYEAGLKSDWLEHRLRFNLTGFHYDYSDLQVQSLLGPGVAAIANAATAKVSGMELEATVRPVAALVLTANYSLLDAHYSNFREASVPGALAPFLVGSPRLNANGTFDATGNRLNAAPRDSASATGQYNWNLGGGVTFLRAEYYWQSRVFYDPSNALIMSQKAYGITNVFLGYDNENGRWGVHLFAKNIGDTHYLSAVVANGVEPAGQAAPPRTYGVQMSKSF
jgi:iron complex outermembrane receptor protein